METPIGFVPLRDAADIVGRKLRGDKWRPIAEANGETIISKLDPEIDLVIRTIAERCEAGDISTAYRSINGAESLDREVWQRPHWRSYFARGAIDLDLPLLDGDLRPNPNGYMARCTREIFVRRDELDRCMATLPKPGGKPPAAARASKRQIGAIVADYRNQLAAHIAPSIEDLEGFAKSAGLIGHRDELRAEYHRQFPHRRVGRPTK